MLYGFYTAASGMFTNQKALSVNANNMANMKTPGFKAQRLVSSPYNQGAMLRYENGTAEVIGQTTPIVYASEQFTKFDLSSIQETERVFDLAIEGEGFFNIETANGRLLTRNGNFDVDNEGFLVLKGVGRVLGENGPLRVGGSNFVVLSNGAVYDENGQDLGYILITVPNEGQQLQQLQNGLYVSPIQNNVTQLQGKISQFALEGSNVDLNSEMAMVMENQRAFQACSRVIKNIDTVNAKTVSEIGRI